MKNCKVGDILCHDGFMISHYYLVLEFRKKENVVKVVDFQRFSVFERPFIRFSGCHKIPIYKLFKD